MKKLFIILFAVCLQTLLLAQNVNQLHDNARAFMHKGDYPNAILILNRALTMQPDNLELAKDLGLNYYYAGDYKKAIDVLSKLFGRQDVDDQCFQIAGDAYWAMDDAKQAEDIYRRGVLKLPSSGPLYNELGKVLWTRGDYTAIKYWEKGIETDPQFAGNYYNASKYYYFTLDRVWSLVYGEIFINIDPKSALAAEIKTILLEGYKKLFIDADLEKNNKDKNGFTKAFLKTMNKQSSLASAGIGVESLSKIRTRFILEWDANYGTKYPFRLFQVHKQYIELGLFDAYNQWVFATEQNLPAYQKWNSDHAKEYNELNRFLEGRIFKLPKGQYYH
ncbi:MAG: tetratricopeptide repeat protein [Chitinophagaceae bacterium]|nr:tetratricopeptide repeat protein [Chitinophagaceae bacterium]